MTHFKATCLDWIRSLAFINREKKFIIMGIWASKWTKMDPDGADTSSIILKDSWKNETVEVEIFDETVEYLSLAACGDFDLYIFEMWPLGSLEEPLAFYSFEYQLIKANVFYDEHTLCWKVEGADLEKHLLKQELLKQERLKKIAENPEEKKSPAFWLEDSISAKEAEGKYMVKMSGEEIPFGYMHSAWMVLLDKMEKGDKLCEFRSSEERWNEKKGREGLALVRKNEIIAEIVTRMN